MFAPLGEHHGYLADTVRMSCLRRAIEEVVRPGDVVVDLGAGTGVLGLLACRAGAARVYAIESTALVGLTRDICRANGFDDRVTFLKGHSPDIELPERADVVVADQMGAFGIDAGVLGYFADAGARFLKPDGVTIPSRIDLFTAPVESPEAWERVGFWQSRPALLDMSSAQILAVNMPHYLKWTPGQLLSPPAQVASIDPVRAHRSMSIDGAVTVARAGVLHGLGGWFSAQLSPSVVMTNSPVGSAGIDRDNLFLPIGEPSPVARGDRIDFRLRVVPAESLISWQVTVSSLDGSPKYTFRHSTFEGMLVCKEDIERTRPDFVPTLTTRGLARHTVLSLCDGVRPLAEIENEMVRLHGDLFPTRREAGPFVASVVGRDSA